jgi:hypothetical protein
MTMYGLSAYIGTEKSGNTWTYAPLADGIDNISEALNETVQQYFFLDGAGFAKNHVTGMAPTFTFSGRRVIGDAAQEFIFGVKYQLDTARATSFKLEYTNDEDKTVTLICDATVCNQQEWSGATTDDSAISFELRFDGPPTVTTSA